MNREQKCRELTELSGGHWQEQHTLRFGDDDKTYCTCGKVFDDDYKAWSHGQRVKP